MIIPKLQSYSFSQLSTLQLFRIMQLRVNIFVVEQACAYPELDSFDLLATHHCYFQNEQLIAYCRTFNYAQSIKIGRILVHHSARMQGVGHKLMRDVLNYHHRAPHLCLQAQARLTAFYAHHGFSIVGDVYDEDGIAHVDMELIK